jgi:hypothetical protein
MAELWALQESLMDDTRYAVSIDGYNCVTHFKCPDIRAGGVAIYEKSGAATMVTPHLLMLINHVESAKLYARADNIGDVCAAEVSVDVFRTLLISVYINPNTSTDDIECFLLYNLMAYSPKFCTMWPSLKRFGYYNMPIILTGEFNFKDLAIYEHFRSFTLEEVGLTVVTDPSRSTTLGGSCIDIFPVRDVPHVFYTTYTTYFSYQYPIFAVT